MWAVIICQFQEQVRRVSETQFKIHIYVFKACIPVAGSPNSMNKYIPIVRQQILRQTAKSLEYEVFSKKVFRRGGYLCTFLHEVKQCNCVLHGSFGVSVINYKSSKYATTWLNMLKGTYFHLSAQYKLVMCYKWHSILRDTLL